MQDIDSGISGRWTAAQDSYEPVCQHTVQLNADYTWEDISFQKRRTGVFTIVSSDDVGSGSKELSLKTLTDNALPDCSSQAYDSKGIAQTLLLDDSDGESVLSVPENKNIDSAIPFSSFDQFSFEGEPEKLPPLVITADTSSPSAGLNTTPPSAALPSENTQSENTQGETTQGETTQGETTQGETTQGETTQGETTQGETSQSETSQSETSQSETSQSETSQSETSQSETSQSETSQSETSQSETSQSETSQSETSQSETSQSETSQSETSQSEEQATSQEESESSSSGESQGTDTTNENESSTVPSTQPTAGTFIQDNEWTITKGENISFGDHSADAGYIPSQANDNSAIRVRLQQGSNWGTGTYFVLPDNIEEAWVSYCIRFADNWDTSVGGKLPGFAGNSSPTNGGQGGAPANGSNAWSARMLYGSYDATNDAIPIGQYVYHTQQSSVSQYGDPDWWAPLPNRLFSESTRVPRLQWHAIKQRIKVNSANSYDGIIEGWYDGVKVYSRTDFNFTNNEAFRNIYRFWLDVYHGGGATSPQHQYVYFDQINYSVGTDQTHVNCAN